METFEKVIHKLQNNWKYTTEKPNLLSDLKSIKICGGPNFLKLNYGIKFRLIFLIAKKSR